MNYQKKMFEEFPNYSIDTLGVFRNEKTNKILKLSYTPIKDGYGYGYVALFNKNCEKRTFAHIAVARMFLNYFDGCHVHHKDNNSSNNCVDNLECLTPFEHRKISFELGHNIMADKAIDQYTLDGIFVKSYTSIMSAYRETKIDFRNISACISGKQKSVKGYIFVDKGKKSPIYKKLMGGRKTYKVYKYNKNGILIKEYDSLHSAYIDSKYSKMTIHNSIHKKNVKGDYFWTREILK